MPRHPVSPKGVLLIVIKMPNFNDDLFKVSKMTNFNYDLSKVSKMTNFNYDLSEIGKMTNFNHDLFKVCKMTNFNYHHKNHPTRSFFMVKNCYKFSKMVIQGNG